MSARVTVVAAAADEIYDYSNDDDAECGIHVCLPVVIGCLIRVSLRQGPLECPQITCMRWNTNCRENLKLVDAFLSGGGSLCLGCMRCPPGAPKLKPGGKGNTCLQL